jgi:hypothetical protein
MLLNRPNRGFVRMLNHEVGEREPLDAGRTLDAFFLLREQTSFCPFRASIGSWHGWPPNVRVSSAHIKRYTSEPDGKGSTVLGSYTIANFRILKRAMWGRSAVKI